MSEEFKGVGILWKFFSPLILKSVKMVSVPFHQVMSKIPMKWGGEGKIGLAKSIHEYFLLKTPMNFLVQLHSDTFLF